MAIPETPPPDSVLDPIAAVLRRVDKRLAAEAEAKRRAAKAKRTDAA